MNKTLMFAAALATSLMASTTSMASKYEVQMAPSQQLERAKNALMKGDAKRAIKLYRAALKRGIADLDAPMTHNNLCIAYLNENLHKEALKHCDLAIRLRPNNWRYWNNRGNVYFQQGNYAEALTQYVRGVGMSPSNEVLIRNIRLTEEIIQQSPAILDNAKSDPDIGDPDIGDRGLNGKQLHFASSE